jgi:hypothetical protein
VWYEAHSSHLKPWLPAKQLLLAQVKKPDERKDEVLVHASAQVEIKRVKIAACTEHFPHDTRF